MNLALISDDGPAPTHDQPPTVMNHGAFGLHAVIVLLRRPGLPCRTLLDYNVRLSSNKYVITDFD